MVRYQPAFGKRRGDRGMSRNHLEILHLIEEGETRWPHLFYTPTKYPTSFILLSSCTQPKGRVLLSLTGQILAPLTVRKPPLVDLRAPVIVQLTILHIRVAEGFMWTKPEHLAILVLQIECNDACTV